MNALTYKLGHVLAAGDYVLVAHNRGPQLVFGRIQRIVADPRPNAEILEVYSHESNPPTRLETRTEGVNTPSRLIRIEKQNIPTDVLVKFTETDQDKQDLGDLWNVLPPWIQWVTHNVMNVVMGFSEKPRLSKPANSYWHGTFPCRIPPTFVPTAYLGVNHRTSLRRRPQGVVNKPVPDPSCSLILRPGIHPSQL